MSRRASRPYPETIRCIGQSLIATDAAQPQVEGFFEVSQQLALIYMTDYTEHIAAMKGLDMGYKGCFSFISKYQLASPPRVISSNHNV